MGSAAQNRGEMRVARGRIREEFGLCLPAGQAFEPDVRRGRPPLAVGPACAANGMLAVSATAG